MPGARAETTLVAWDFKSSEPLMKPYFEFVRKTFEAAHPGVKVRQVAQPEDSYYTERLGGRAKSAKENLPVPIGPVKP
jgi:hypothetical protein